jgi:hypothetical protein
VESWRIGSILFVVAAVSAALGGGGCGSTTGADSQRAQATGPSGASGLAGRKPRPHCPGADTSLHHLKPARIVSGPKAAIETENVAQVVNGWTYTSPCGDMTVQAGAADAGKTTGALVISCLCVRGSSPYRSQLLEIGGTGPLRIIRAPEGARSQASLDTATLQFAGDNGARGTLDMKTGRATCSNARPACQPLPVQGCKPLQEVEAASSAGGIRAWGMDCAAADEFVQHAPSSCANSAPCSADGFVCKENGDPAVGNVPVWCQRGSQRIDINWIVT